MNAINLSPHCWNSDRRSHEPFSLCVLPNSCRLYVYPFPFTFFIKDHKLYIQKRVTWYVQHYSREWNNCKMYEFARNFIWYIIIFCPNECKTMCFFDFLLISFPIHSFFFKLLLWLDAFTSSFIHRVQTNLPVTVFRCSNLHVWKAICYTNYEYFWWYFIFDLFTFMM